KMKSLQIAVVLLVFSIGTCKCNHCVGGRPGSSCYKSVETCTRPEDVCASAISSFTTYVYSYFKRCMKASDAFILNASPHYQVFTCTTDRCN
uniref:UPAR/Ly6 domain-containing protein n=1 Tax=Neogobius melanostomus TaxID=47308 RepID=A0A8C6U434_9GOBI